MSRAAFTAELMRLARESLSHDEVESFAVLQLALSYAIDCAQALPATLDGRARTLIVTKLQEADHWCLELIRIAAK